VIVVVVVMRMMIRILKQLSHMLILHMLACFTRTKKERKVTLH
jgi:hypothetical protein